MVYLHKIILTGFQLAVFLVIVSCSSTSNKEEVLKLVDAGGKTDLKMILDDPRLYVNRDIMFEGVIESVGVRKVNDDISLLMVKMTLVENGDVLKTAPVSTKFQFIRKLRQFEDLFTAVRYKDVRIRRRHAESMKSIGFDLKIEASRVEALAYYFEGMGKTAVSQSIHKVAAGYSKLADAYFNFYKAALESSPGMEEIAQADYKRQIEQFENNIRQGGSLLIEFSADLNDLKELILDGHFSFDTAKALNRQKSAEILTYSSLLNAESWKKGKQSKLEAKNISAALAVAVKDLGQGDKLVNDGLLELGNTLNKTAIEIKKGSVPTIKCAYYGYNGSHLRRSAKMLKQMKHFPVEMQGKLLQSDLREEVNIMWVNIKHMNIDGMDFMLDYGDENATFRKAAGFYEWAESVEKGD